jgi:hypothetical protein
MKSPIIFHESKNVKNVPYSPAQESTAMPEALPVYHPRDPAKSPLWNILYNNYEEFKAKYDEGYEKQYSFFRPIIDDVVHDYLKCGDLKEGFARIRCTNESRLPQ